MSQPDSIPRSECPICKSLVPNDELWDNSGLCFRCDTEQQEVMSDNAPTREQRKEQEDEEQEKENYDRE